MADDTEINSQITDAVAQVNAMVGASSEALARAMADQVMAHAVGLAMHNAVAQQQHQYMLRNAMTTAACRALLEASPEDALRYASEIPPGDDIAQTLERLRALMGGDDAAAPAAGG